MDKIYEYALSLWGKPYLWGGEGPIGYDCSGYIRSILAYAGIPLPHDMTAEQIYLYYKQYGLELSLPGKGALVFFGESGRVSHVGWMIDAKILISAAGGNRHCTTVEYAQKIGAAVKIQPLTYYRKPIGFLLPKY